MTNPHIHLFNNLVESAPTKYDKPLIKIKKDIINDERPNILLTKISLI